LCTTRKKAGRKRLKKKEERDAEKNLAKSHGARGDVCAIKAGEKSDPPVAMQQETSTTWFWEVGQKKERSALGSARNRERGEKRRAAARKKETKVRPFFRGDGIRV